MPDVTIRPARPDDALAIAAIHVASWQHAYRGILPDDYLAGLSPDDRLPMWAHTLTLPDAPTYVGVAEVDGQVVGFYSIGKSDEGDPPHVQMLYTIYMHPGTMGKGIGRLLMDDAERQMVARGATLGVLRVITANERTLAFYERCGWTPDPSSLRMEDAWGQQVETIRYRKRLG
jgi:ribosomal protein S18 acetylase RimI-like enzyme